jgi:4-hydroxy-3-methylbut-2-enyl diphosphate reductase
MHILNNLIGRHADKYNDPDRASFYEANKWILTLFAVVTGAAGLVVAFTVGPVPFIILLGMSITGLSYNFQLVPKSLKWLKYRSIRDIPGSKTVLIAMAWGMVTSVFPSLFISSGFERVAVVFLWVAGLVFVRTGFFDILDMQGDRIVGKETIPILLGEKKANHLLKAILIIIGIILPLSSLFGVIPALGFILLLCPMALFVVLVAYEKGQMLPGIRLEFLVDTHFLLAGFLTGIWVVLSG